MKTILALFLLLLPTLARAASSATVNGEVLVAPTNLVLRSVDPAKGTLRIVLPAGMQTNGFAVYDSSSNLLFGVSSNGAIQAFSPWSVLGSSTNLLTGTNLPGTDGDVLTKGPTGLFMATPTGGGSANAITNVARAGTGFISLIYTSNNFTILLATLQAGANVWLTNNGTNIVFAGPSTNGFVTQTITNGFATISYVNGATQGLVTASVTNGLATISYTDTKLNSTSNSLLSQIVSSQVWTNDGQFIYWSGQPAVVPNSATPGPMFFLSTNGSMFIGQNVNQDTTIDNFNIRNYESFSLVDSNEPSRLFFSQVVADNENYGYYSYWSYNLIGDKDVGVANWYMESSITNGTTDEIFADTDPAHDFLGTGLLISRNNTRYTKLLPSALNDGTLPYLFDTFLTKTSGNLLEVRNNGADRFTVDYTGATRVGPVGFQIVLDPADGIEMNGGDFQIDYATATITEMRGWNFNWPAAPAVGFLHDDGAGNMDWSTLPFTNLASYPDHTALTNGANNIKTLSGGVTDQGTNVAVDISASASNALVNLSSNSVAVAPGTGTSISTSYVSGKVVYTVNDSEVASTMVKTNFVLNQVYTNTSAQPILVNATTFLVPAAVNGDCAIDLMYSTSGNTGYTLAARVGVGTLITVGITQPLTNQICAIFTNLGSYYFTNTSSGIGNSAGLVAGTGQYVVIGGGAQGPAGAAGTGGIATLNGFGTNTGFYANGVTATPLTITMAGGHSTNALSVFNGPSIVGGFNSNGVATLQISNSATIYPAQYTLYSQTVDGVAATNITSTQTSVLGSGIGSLTLPAGFWQVGRNVTLNISGPLWTSGSPGNSKCFVMLGSTIVATNYQAQFSANAFPGQWQVQVSITCKTNSASGAVQVSGSTSSGSGAGASYRLFVDTITIMDTTPSMLVDLQVTNAATTTSTPSTQATLMMK